MDDGGSSAGFFSKIFKRREETAEDEIASILSEGQDQGTILESEAEMITNIFELDDIEASEIMTHRKNICAIDGNDKLEDVMQIICESTFSRFPVYQESIDNIIGILHIRDAVKAYINESLHDKKLIDIAGVLQKVYFIPETSKINGIFKNMQSQNIHMEVVVDEYGQTAGIIAMEDIIEEIVGNIFDEHDVVEYNVTKVSDGVFDIKGLTALSEVEEMTGVEFSDEENDTLNGYLVSKLNRIPDEDVGTEISDDNAKYVILKVEDKTIALVRMEILKPFENKED